MTTVHVRGGRVVMDPWLGDAIPGVLSNLPSFPIRYNECLIVLMLTCNEPPSITVPTTHLETS